MERASQMAERFHQLRSAVELEIGGRKPSDALAAACKDLAPKAASLALLAQALLSGAPYRLLRDAVVLTAKAVRKGQHAAELLRSAPLLWSEGLSSPNREVRVHLLALFTALAPEWVASSSGLREDELDRLTRGVCKPQPAPS